jgi:hypothetical protein
LLSITNLDRLELGTELGAKQKDNVLIEEAHSARGFGLTDDELDAQLNSFSRVEKLEALELVQLRRSKKESEASLSS